MSRIVDTSWQLIVKCFVSHRVTRFALSVESSNQARNVYASTIWRPSQWNFSDKDSVFGVRKTNKKKTLKNFQLKTHKTAEKNSFVWNRIVNVSCRWCQDAKKKLSLVKFVFIFPFKKNEQKSCSKLNQIFATHLNPQKSLVRTNQTNHKTEL